MDTTKFLSTPSARRATLFGVLSPALSRNFYPRPPRGGRLHSVFCPCFLVSISIHALREEGDNEQSGDFEEAKEFLSTPSARRATSCARLLCRPSRYFYPRPPRGGRPDYINAIEWTDVISIHALREEGDFISWLSLAAEQGFLSTPSARRATALHLEHYPVKWNFYPRPPRGGRPAWRVACSLMTSFLSTPSARRATFPEKLLGAQITISIHALREEGDAPMCRSRPCAPISIHALREEGDPAAADAVLGVVAISIHALREEGDDRQHGC